MKREARERHGQCHECGMYHRIVCTHPVTKCLCGERVRLSLVEKRGCDKCGGTGYVDAPSHSVERSQFGVGPVGVYVCKCRRSSPCASEEPPK